MYGRSDHGTIKLPSAFGLNAVYGTTMGQTKPSTLYIRTRAKIIPIPNAARGTVKDMERMYGQILSMFQETVNENPHFDNRILSNLDYSTKNLAAGKSVFLRYDIHLRPKKLETLPEQYNRVERLASTVGRRLSTILRNVGLQADDKTLGLN